MYYVYNLIDIFVFNTDDLELAKREVRRFGGTIKDKDDNILFEVSEDDKKIVMM